MINVIAPEVSQEPALWRRVRQAPSPVLTILALICTLVALGRLIVGVLGVFDPRVVEDVESILYAQTTRIVQGQPLYQPLDRPPYTVVAYMPLYYELAAGARALIGPGFASGRALSLLAGLVAVGLLARIASNMTGDRWAGVLAPAMFLTFGFPHFPWFAQFRVDMLGITLSLAAIWVVIGGTSLRRVFLAGVVAGLALLTKQTQVAAVFAVTIFWLGQRDWRRVLLFLFPCAAMVLAVAIVYESAAHAFFDNAVTANVVPFTWGALATNMPTLVRFQALSLVIAGVYVLHTARISDASNTTFMMWYWLFSFLPLVGLAKIGSYDNYWIELAAATAVLVTLAVWGAFRSDRTTVSRRVGIAASVLLIVNTAAVVSDYVPVLVTRGAAVLRPHALATAQNTVPPSSISSAGDFSALVQRVRTERSEVLASPMDVVALADRQVLLEGFIFDILYTQHRWDPRTLVGHICDGKVGLLVVDRPLESSLYDDEAATGLGFFVEPILAALRERMVLETEAAQRLVYVPGAPPRPAGTHACDGRG